MFDPVFPKHFSVYTPPPPPNISTPPPPPPPLVYKLTQNPCEVILAQGFNVEFYGSSELDWYVQ